MLARSAARSGLRTVLVERHDFGAGVTSRTTRLIHGGLRYLERFEIGLVRESLRDRERLLREFPGLVRPQPFLLPAYDADARPAWYLAAGLRLYRLLCWGGSLPPPRRVSVAETLALLPGVDESGLRCSFEYFDCQAALPERLALEAALQAEDAGAEIRNHTRATGFSLSGSQLKSVRVDGPSGSEQLHCRLVVNAAGAWIDQVLGMLPDAPLKPVLALVNGTHIVVPDFPGSPRHAVYREARSDRRPFFIVPWRGQYLIGTTEMAFDGNPDDPAPTDQEVRYLIDEANRLFLGTLVTPETVLYAYSGSRPLLRSNAAKLQAVSRGYAVIDHGRTDGIGGLVTMAGGKLTTAPSFADETLRHVMRKLGLRHLRAGGPPERTRLDGIPPRIARGYGPRAPELMRYIQSKEGLDRPFCPECETTCGEILFAVEREKARTLGDILLRRTGLAFEAGYEPSWARKVAELVGPRLGWTRTSQNAEIDASAREVSATLAGR